MPFTEDSLSYWVERQSPTVSLSPLRVCWHAPHLSHFLSSVHLKCWGKWTLQAIAPGWKPKSPLSFQTVTVMGQQDPLTQTEVIAIWPVTDCTFLATHCCAGVHRKAELRASRGWLSFMSQPSHCPYSLLMLPPPKSSSCFHLVTVCHYLLLQRPLPPLSTFLSYIWLWKLKSRCLIHGKQARLVSQSLTHSWVLDFIHTFCC